MVPAAAGAQQRPDVVTGAPIDIGPTSATFTGTVTPNGARTYYAFVYGTARYNAHTPVVDAGDGSAPVAVSAHVEGLSAATTYHVRLVALGHGIGFGEDVTFATLAAAAPVPVPVAPTPTPAPPPPGLPTSSPSLVPPPPPVLGESVNVQERSGAVRVKVPGATGYAPITEVASVPVGSIVDTRAGSVTLKSAVKGGVQTGIFHGGLFEVRQPKSAGGLTELRLRGPLPTCGTRSAQAAATSKRRRRPPRRLWGRDNHGNFRTRGGNSVATVRGTAWYVEDRCAGTLTRVSSGSVSVRDLRRHRTVIVRAGHSYLARAKR